MRSFSHPDYTVGFGISPNQPGKAHGLYGSTEKFFCVTLTVGSELHSTLKLLSSIPNSLQIVNSFFQKKWLTFFTLFAIL